MSPPPCRPPFDPRRAGLALVLAALVGGVACASLYDLSAVQCEADGDCTGALAGRICQRGLCVAPDTTGSAGEGGNAGADAGGGDGGRAGGAPDGAAGAAGAPVECTSNGECMDDHHDEPYLCRDGRCIELKTTECPRVLLPENLRVPEPIVVGAYGNTSEERQPQILSYELALKELTGEIGGLSGGPSGSLRNFVAVVCNSVFENTTPGNLDHLRPSLDHLVGTLKVPAILAALGKSDLKLAYAAIEAERQADTPLFLSPLSADSDLEQVDHRGLLWHVLGNAVDLGPAFVALTEATERRLALAEPLRLALVYSDVATLVDIAGYVEESLEFNGKGTFANGEDGNFLAVKVAYEQNDANADYTPAVLALQDFKPHVVVAITGGEFVTKLLQPLESLNAARPQFYVLGHYLSYRPSLLNAMTNYYQLNQRVAGINFAGAADPTALNGYISRFNATYLGTSDPTSQENFYDATYYLMYAIAGAGHTTPFVGSDVARGLRRLLDPSSPFQYTVGPSDLSNGLAALAVTSNTSIGLSGTLGPPDWDLGTGARRSAASAWCVVSDPTVAYAFVYDQMRFDPELGDFPADEGLEACGILGF